MYCSKCGQELLEDDRFCSKCGQKVKNSLLNQNYKGLSKGRGFAQIKSIVIVVIICIIGAIIGGLISGGIAAIKVKSGDTDYAASAEIDENAHYTNDEKDYIREKIRYYYRTGEDNGYLGELFKKACERDIKRGAIFGGIIGIAAGIIILYYKKKMKLSLRHSFNSSKKSPTLNLISQEGMKDILLSDSKLKNILYIICIMCNLVLVAVDLSYINLSYLNDMYWNAAHVVADVLLCCFFYILFRKSNGAHMHITLKNSMIVAIAAYIVSILIELNFLSYSYRTYITDIIVLITDIVYVTFYFVLYLALLGKVSKKVLVSSMIIAMLASVASIWPDIIGAESLDNRILLFTWLLYCISLFLFFNNIRKNIKGAPTVVQINQHEYHEPI